jgi:hypothetical protein
MVRLAVIAGDRADRSLNGRWACVKAVPQVVVELGEPKGPAASEERNLVWRDSSRQNFVRVADKTVSSRIRAWHKFPVRSRRDNAYHIPDNNPMESCIWHIP